MEQLHTFVGRQPWAAHSLFAASDQELSKSLKVLRYIDSLDNTCFYGRPLGFQVRIEVRYRRIRHFCSSLHLSVMSFTLLALYSQRTRYDGSVPPLEFHCLSIWSTQVRRSVRMHYKKLHSGRFILSAEQRAKRIVQVTREADISLCKGFWNLSEEGLYYVR